MLDAFLVLEAGGRVLFVQDFQAQDTPTGWAGSPLQQDLHHLLQDGLIAAGAGFAFAPPPTSSASDRQAPADGGGEHFSLGSRRFEWAWDNGSGLLLVAAYQQALGTLDYVPSLFALVRQLFLAAHASALPGSIDGGRAWPPTLTHVQATFAPVFAEVLAEVEARHRCQKKVQRSFQESKKAKARGGSKAGASRNAEATNAIITQLKAKHAGPRLDFSQEADPSGKDEQQQRAPLSAEQRSELAGTGMGDFVGGRYDALELVSTTQATPMQSSSLFSFFTKAIRLARPIEAADLAPVLVKTREHLMSKNVAADVATHICDSISTKLVGKSISAFSALSTHIQAALEECLTAILTPRTSLDMLRDIQAARAAGRPYSIVYVGVNGVGKSTNLSKMCFWLLCNGLKVLIAACDTFRSGAVEQLGVHVRNLRKLREGVHLELFDRGYGKDPAAIAREAIAHAQAEGFDVVLIDTAGRMQDNEPLMRALAKLVCVNKPSKIVFVGEALVGNNASDQLSKFNRALVEYSTGPGPARQIDGIILSKLDTVDDRVGAALSMTFVTGAPILFAGVGQTYTDLRRLHVPSIVSMLVK